MPRRSPRLAPAPSPIRGTIAKDDSRFVTAGSVVRRPARFRLNTFRLKGFLLITGRKRRRRSISTAPGWVELWNPTLRAACPAARSFFVRAAPTDVNEFVVRERRPLRDQSIALGLDVGGRIARVLPDEKHPPLAGVSFLELVQPVQRRQRRQRRLRHGSTPSLDVLVMRRHWRARGRVRAWRGAPRNPASPAPARRCRRPWRCRRPPTARARRPRPRPRSSPQRRRCRPQCRAAAIRKRPARAFAPASAGPCTCEAPPDRRLWRDRSPCARAPRHRPPTGFATGSSSGCAPRAAGRRDFRFRLFETAWLSLLCLDANEYAARGRVASAQQKARRGVPPGRLGAVLVNTLFWKILVTRVKRKMRRKKNMTPDRPSAASAGGSIERPAASDFDFRAKLVRNANSVATRPHAAANISHTPATARLPVTWIR